MTHSDEHFSAESLYDLVKHLDDTIGIATVYRTLELFEKLKIVRNVKIKNDGINYYDLMELGEETHLHHHLICTKCGKKLLRWQMNLKVMSHLLKKNMDLM